MSKARILVIEDDADLRAILDYNLRAEGYETVLVGTAGEGLAAVRAGGVDLILLDIVLPDRSGFDVCRDLARGRRGGPVPIIIVSGRAEEMDRVVGLELGAEDYVVKPFSNRELLLRVAKVLWRQPQPAPETGELHPCTLIRIDTNAHRVWANGQPVDITPMEYRMLLALARRADTVTTRPALAREVWGARMDRVRDGAVKILVQRLRQKLGSGGVCIENVRGVGYRFACHASSTEL